MSISTSKSYARRVFLSALALSLVVIALAILLGLFKYPDRPSPTRYFTEGRFPTIFSIALLLTTGVFLFLAFRRRWQSGARFGTGAAIWLVGSVSFIFFALDEGLQIHENFDKWIHSTVLEREETALTDRIDDFIIVAYGLVGLVTLVVCAREALRFRDGWRYAVITVIAASGSIFLDILTNGLDTDTDHWNDWFLVAEDSLKIIAEAGFVAAAAFVFRASAFVGNESGRSAVLRYNGDPLARKHKTRCANNP